MEPLGRDLLRQKDQPEDVAMRSPSRPFPPTRVTRAMSTTRGGPSTLFACILLLLSLGSLWAISADADRTPNLIHAAMHPGDQSDAQQELPELPAGDHSAPDPARAPASNRPSSLNQTSGGYEHFATWPLPVASFIPEDVAINNNGYVALCDQHNHRVLYYDSMGVMVNQSLPSSQRRRSRQGSLKCRVDVDTSGANFLVIWGNDSAVSELGYSAEDRLETREQTGKLVYGPTVVVDRDDLNIHDRIKDRFEDIAVRRDGTLLSLHREGVFFIDTKTMTETGFVERVYREHRPKVIGEWKTSAWMTAENRSPGGQPQGSLNLVDSDGTRVARQPRNKRLFFDLDSSLDREIMIYTASATSDRWSTVYPQVDIYDPQGSLLRSIKNEQLGGFSLQSKQFVHHRLARSPKGDKLALTASHGRFSVRSHTSDGELLWEVKSLLSPSSHPSRSDGFRFGSRVSEFPLPLDVDSTGRLLVLDTRLDKAPLLELDTGGKARIVHAGDPARGIE